MATGRDAADVAITTSFGLSWLNRFQVVTDEVVESAVENAAEQVTPAVAQPLQMSGAA
jgi:hypothetical protein